MTLVAALAHHTTILTLLCHNTGANDLVAQALAKLLMIHPSLRAVGLAGNVITDTGTIELAAALAINRVCVSLNLSANRVRNNGAVALAQAVARPGCVLRHLNLSSNVIGDVGALAFIPALQVM